MRYACSCSYRVRGRAYAVACAEEAVLTPLLDETLKYLTPIHRRRKLGVDSFVGLLSWEKVNVDVVLRPGRTDM